MEHSIILYFVIFFAKILEVSMATTRIVILTKGERLLAAFIGFFEVLLWVAIAATVLGDITSDPIKVVVYAFGFSVGNYMGSTIEKKLALGTTKIEAILNAKTDEGVVNKIREEGFAVTTVNGEGYESSRHILIMHVKRKNTDRAINLVKSLATDAVITINEIKPVYGGYGILRK